jgi:hypothetical protein
MKKSKKTEKNPKNRGKINGKRASPEAIFKMKKEKFQKKFASAGLKAWPSFEIFFLGKKAQKKIGKKICPEGSG